MMGLTFRALYGAFKGRWINLDIASRPWLRLVLAVTVLVLAIHQQLNVGFLLANPAG